MTTVSANSAGVRKPPFPVLIREEFGEGKPKLFFWEGWVSLESWKGFAPLEEIWEFFESASEVETGGKSRISVKPVEPSATEPTDEQCMAFQHLLDNETTIQHAVLQAVFEAYPKWRESYYGPVSSDGGKSFRPITEFPDLYHPEKMPEISEPNELVRLVRPHTVHVLAKAIDGQTRIGFEFACKWDEEHGLGVLTHKGKVVDVGDGTAAFDHG